MQLKLFNFSKRRNSTKQPPTDYPATLVEVFLKKPTSVSEPTFIISGVNVLSEAINYCLWEDRYYFVTDITYLNNDNCEIHCSIDVLATFKTQIGNYTAFVERSASSYDVMVNDELLTGRQEVVNTSYRTTNFTLLNGNGCYIVRTVGKDGLNTYAIESLTTIASIYILQELFNGEFHLDTESIENALEDIKKILFKPSDYVLSVIWIPVPIGNISGVDGQTVTVGYWESDITAKRVTGKSVGEALTLNFPPRYYNDFRDNNPNFTNVNMYLPGVGTIAVNPLDLTHGALDITYSLDLLTGSIMYSITDNDLWNMGTYEGQLGVTIQIGGTAISSNTFMSALAGAGSVISGAIMKNPLALTAGASGIVHAVQNIINPTPSVNGSQGNQSKYNFKDNIQISVANLGSKEYPTAVNGRPCYQNKKLNTLTGFVKCGAASIELNAHSDERDKINDFLNSGFYYE